MNEHHNHIETFLNENEVLGRINELKTKGISENDMYVLSEDKEDSTMLTDTTDVHYKNAEGSFEDKFVSFFAGEEPDEKVLDEFGFSEREKSQYAQDLREGKILLYADGDIRENGTNMNNMELENREDRDREKMELHEEKLDVDKHRRQVDEVEVNKQTTHDKQEFDVPVTHEEVTVERRPVNEERNAGSETAYKDKDHIRVPVHEEEVEVNKKDVVKEEIVVDKKEAKENVHVDEDVRREEADISDSSNLASGHNQRNDRSKR